MKRIKLAIQGVLGGLVLLAGTNIHAGLPSPPPIDELTAFYEATGGDNWHRNDHWLDEEIHHCDWYGIICHDDISPRGIHSIRLPGNNLTGDMTEIVELLHDISSSFHRQLDLSNNRITGELLEFPRARSLNLSQNLLGGQLPEAGDFIGRDAERPFIGLAGNQFEGAIPQSWEDLELEQLDLAENDLEGGIDVAVAAMSTDHSIGLSLAGNRFSGPLPETLMALSPFRLDGSRTGPASTLWSAAFPPGLDLCWNDFDTPDAEMSEFIDEHHHGGGFSDCQQARLPIDPVTSGSWFNPERAGEGFVQHLLDTGQVLLFWFTFPRSDHQQQSWYLGLAPTLEDSIRFEDMHGFSGQFGAGSHDLETSPFRLSINPLESDRQQISYSRSIILGGSMTGLVSYGLTSQRYDHVPLTHLAGSTCDNRQSNQWISGAWYDPERNGEGFMVEVDADGLGVVYWFTYTPGDSGNKAWMMGDGEFDGQTLVIDNLVQPTGTVFGADFDPNDVEFTPWGSLVMEFHDDLNGHISFDSVFEDYGSGDYPIERLTRPMLAECE